MNLKDRSPFLVWEGCSVHLVWAQGSVVVVHMRWLTMMCTMSILALSPCSRRVLASDSSEHH